MGIQHWGKRSIVFPGPPPLFINGTAHREVRPGQLLGSS